MSITLRILLAVISFFTSWYALRKIRKSQMQIEDALYWIIVSGGLVVLSIFPQIAIFFSNLIGIESASNFVFLIMIFMVLIKLFFLSLDVSQLKHKLILLIQENALAKEESDKKRETDL